MTRPAPEPGSPADGAAASAGADGADPAGPDGKPVSRSRTGEASSIPPDTSVNPDITGPHDTQDNPISPIAPGPAPRPVLWVLLLLLIATVLVGAVGLFTYRYLRDDLQAQTHRTLTVIAEQKRQQIENWVAQTRMDAESYFSGHSPHAIAFAQWLDGGRQSEDLIAGLRSRMAEIARMRRWGGLALCDQEGSAAFTVGEGEARLDRDRIQEALRHPAITTIDLHLTPQGMAVYGLLAPFGLPGEPPRGWRI